MAKKKNWDLIRKQKDTETTKYRDVYEDQQLERGSIAEKQTMFGRIILDVVISLLVFIFIWYVVSIFQSFSAPKLDDDADPSDDYFHVNSYYVNSASEDLCNIKDSSGVLRSDTLSIDEYNAWYKIYHEYDSQRKETDSWEGDVPVNDLGTYRSKFKYSDGKYIFGEQELTPEEYQKNLRAYEADLNKKLEEYDLYYKRHNDPSAIYVQINDHYRAVDTDSTFITTTAYDQLVADYEKQKEKGKISEDVLSIPLKPMDPSLIYEGRKQAYISNKQIWDENGISELPVPKGVSTEEFDLFISRCGNSSSSSTGGIFDTQTTNLPWMTETTSSDSEENIKPFAGVTSIVNSPFPLEGYPAPDPNDTDAMRTYSQYKTFYDALKSLFKEYNLDSYEAYWNLFVTYCNAVHYDRETREYEVESTFHAMFTEYRNKYDGTVISRLQYDELVNKYEQDFARYESAYHDHRVQYHPDNIDGSSRKINAAPNVPKFFISLIFAGIVFGIMYGVLKKNLDAQNLMSDTSDINQYHNDQHIALPEEVQKNYDWFPDVGAHSSVQVSSMISHMAIQNKGLKKVTMAKRADKDIKDENGDIEYYKGDIILDEEGNPVTYSESIIDKDFMEALFDASGAPKDKAVRKYYDTTKIPYNPENGNRDKLPGYDTVADLINNDWDFPLYEPQRPGGAYIVDTAPVNTMVLAITRAGKGQTVIEPTLDMWMREKRPNNMVVNDPKGELLVKNYVRATVRGLQVVQFNLINAMKTDIYNPLALAADAAREGDNTKCAMYVENIAEVFFPVDGADDPVWPNAANNAFKRAAYGLIDFYLEEEKAMRRMAERTHVDEKVLEQRIDEMWGKVTLYNCYQLFVQLSSKKMKNPAIDFRKKADKGEFSDLPDDEYRKKLSEVAKKSKIWDDKEEADLLTLYFSATDMLPRNSMRTLVANANNALKAMGGAEKMMASVYGIAITAMSFFTDPTISTLTSGTLNQNVDLGSLSFPRRMGVRFNSDYMQKYHFVGQQAVWDAFEDINFEHCLGKLFHHDDTVSREGWARYYFDGKFEKEISYVRLEIRNPTTNNLIRTFYFKFRKNYQTSLDGRFYMKDPVLEEKIVKNGILIELRKFQKKDGTIIFKEGKTTFEQEKVLDIENSGEKTKVKTNAIISTMARYAEKPKMVFLVTPPHLMKYAKLILILIKQLVDMNFDKSYMTKSNQKPLYKTRYMLDELGNLQSEGHGISGFETMLSIGLGQEQQFTLILQTLQQLKDVYGDSVDKIVQGNTSNIVFLKSTDDSMIETLSKMSGTRHKTYTDSKTITKDMQAVLKKMNQNEAKTSYTMTTKEEPVISYNDMAFISERNSIVFRAGDSPIWNRNETILPMSWRLFKNTIVQPGKEYTLQTIPTLSTAMDFDVRKNQPNFSEMLKKRMDQACIAEDACESYQKAYGYEDYDIAQLDPDNYSDDIMDLIYSTLTPQEAKENIKNEANGEELTHSEEEMEEVWDYMFGSGKYKKSEKYNKNEVYDEFSTVSDNPEQAQAIADAHAEIRDAEVMRYAGKMISREMLVSKTGVNHSLDDAIIRVYKAIRSKMEHDSSYFQVKEQVYTITESGSKGSDEKVSVDKKEIDLCGRNGEVFIRNLMSSDNISKINEAAKDENKRVFAENDMSNEDATAIGSCKVTDAFLRYLVTFPRAWPFADGEFERLMKDEMEQGTNLR